MAEIFSLFKKIYLAFKSVFLFLLLKIRYRSRISLAIINSIKGQFKVELGSGANLQIGNFFMTSGPEYIKCLEESYLSIGNRVFLNHNCAITCVDRIEIGDNCAIANNVVIIDHDHKISDSGIVDGYTSAQIKIGRNVWIGANSTILKGVSIGDGSIIAAGAVVNKDIPPFELWGGIPAMRIRSLKQKK